MAASGVVSFGVIMYVHINLIIIHTRSLTYRTQGVLWALALSLITVWCLIIHFSSPGELTMPIHESDSDSVDVLLLMPSKLVV